MWDRGVRALAGPDFSVALLPNGHLPPQEPWASMPSIGVWITLSYALDYTMQADGDNGLYAASLDLALVTLNNGYVVDRSNAFCDAAVTLSGASLVSQVETAGSDLVVSLEAPATVGETV